MVVSNKIIKELINFFLFKKTKNINEKRNIIKNSPLNSNVKALVRDKRNKLFLLISLVNRSKNKLINSKYKKSCIHAEEINPLL